MDKRLVVVSDTQAPFFLPQCVALVCAFVRDFKPDTFIFNGDVCDFVTISKFNKNGRFTPTKVAQEIAITLTDVVFPMLEAIGWRIKWELNFREAATYGTQIPYVTIHSVKKGNAEVIWNEGNHEARLSRYTTLIAPALDGLVEFEEVFQLRKLGVKYQRGRGDSGNGITRLTPLLAVGHGEYHGESAAKTTMRKWKGSFLGGHGHTECTHREVGASGIDWVVLISSCLCQDPSWRGMAGYTRGFIAGEYESYGKGEFNVDHMRISGQDWTRLYTPYGRYEAVKGKQGWTAHRVGKKAD